MIHSRYDERYPMSRNITRTHRPTFGTTNHMHEAPTNHRAELFFATRFEQCRHARCQGTIIIEQHRSDLAPHRVRALLLRLHLRRRHGVGFRDGFRLVLRRRT